MQTDARPLFDRPVFIIAPPRSGTTLLYSLLSTARDVWTIGGESHVVIEAVEPLQARARGWESNRLTAADARESTVRPLVEGFRARLSDRDGKPPPPGASGLRFLEKTPRNCLRVGFFAAAFPDARFIYLYREPRETVSSMLDAWRSPRFVTYPELPGWPGPRWSMLLVPGWRELAGKELAEVVARQWESATAHLLDDLEALPPERRCVARYARLVEAPQEEAERLCAWMGVAWDRPVRAPLPPSRSILEPPKPDKWRRNAEELARVLPLVAPTAERAARWAA
ncbi:MAG TPA: sulfotransferase [Longimicrobium sp.]|nr:sulfotransferase [Longimicrobium sp.]